MNPIFVFHGAASDRHAVRSDAAGNDRRTPESQWKTSRQLQSLTVDCSSVFFPILPKLVLATIAVMLWATLSSCRPAEKPEGDSDPYLVRIEFTERKLDELRETMERRFQDERVRRENQLAVQDRTLREMQQQLVLLETRVSKLSTQLTQIETTRVNRAVVEALPPLPPSPNIASPPPISPTISVQPPKLAETSFPLVVTDITSFVVPVRTQMTVRVVETGKTVRDESGRRVPEVKTETYPIYEYEYRLRFTASNQTASAISFQAEAGYGPLVFNLSSGEILAGKEMRWRPGASLLLRTKNQYQLFPVPPPSPP